MVCYPVISSATEDSGGLVINYTLNSPAGSIIATRVVHVIATSFKALRDAVQDDMADYLVSVSDGDRLAALQAVIAQYTTDDWKGWGL